MEILFDALSHYIDFLVLGAVALAVFCAPFGFVKPLNDGWSFLNKLVGDSHTFIQVGLISGVFFAVFYFAGYFLNSFGHASLREAHFRIINKAASFDLKKAHNDIPAPDSTFYGRLIPIVGALVLDPPEEQELKNYWLDAERQAYWELCDEKSYDDLLGGAQLQQLRLLHGFVGLTQVLLLLCVIAFYLSFFDRTRYVENQRQWSLATFAIALVIYFRAVIPAYWDVEFELHSTIWSLFPSDQSSPNKELSFETAAPCKKMTTLAKLKNNQESNQSEESPKPAKETK